MESQGWDPARLLALGDEELERLFLSERSQTDNQRKKVLFDLFPGYEKEMQRTGVNRFSLCNEYKAANPEGYQYTQFLHQLPGLSRQTGWEHAF